jgi:predicted ATPase with chaperone activity
LTGQRSIADFLENMPTLDVDTHITSGVDFAQIHGQEHAKRALIISATGGHNMLMQ